MKRNIFFTFISKFCIAVFSFFTSVLIARFLGAEGKGIVSLLGVVMGLFNLTSGFVGGPSLVYIVPKHPEKNFLFPSFLWCIVCVAVLYIIILFTQPLPSKYISHATVLGFIGSLFVPLSMMLWAKQKLIHHNLLNLINATVLLTLVLLTFVLLQSASVINYIRVLYTTTAFALLAALIFNWNILTKRFFRFSSKNISLLMGYGFSAQLSNLVQYLNFRLDFYFLKLLRNTYDVGVYSVGTTISEVTFMVTSSISFVLYPNVVNADSPEERVRLTRKCSRIALLINFFIVSILVLMPAQLWTFVFGKDFGDVRLIIWCLSPAILFGSVWDIVAHYFAGIGRYWTKTQGSLIGLLATIILDLLLIPKFGYIGAGIASSISYMVTSIFVVTIFLKETNTSLKSLLILQKDDYLTIKNLLKSYYLKKNL